MTIFDVAIWSSILSIFATKAIADQLLPRQNPLFIWTHCDRTMTLVIHKGRPIYLKLLSSIQVAYPKFDPSNVVFIDTDPLVLVSNSSHTSLCPPPDIQISSPFFTDTLLPYLLLLEHAWDVRCFLENHHPGWSTTSIKASQLTRAYRMLVRLKRIVVPGRTKHVQSY